MLPDHERQRGNVWSELKCHWKRVFSTKEEELHLLHGWGAEAEASAETSGFKATVLPIQGLGAARAQLVSASKRVLFTGAEECVHVTQLLQKFP